jgi:integrase
MFEPAALSEAPSIPRAEWRWQQKQREHLERRARENLSRRHVREIDRVLTTVNGLLTRSGLACDPSRFGDEHLDFLLGGPWKGASMETPGLSPRTRKYNLCLLNGFLKAHGNLTIDKRKIRLPGWSVRPTEALSEQEARRVLATSETLGVEAHTIVALELLMGLRRCEVLRLRLVDLGPDLLTVHGKGIEGGKIRRIPYHEEVRRVLRELVAHRQQVVSGHSGPDAGFLFVHVERAGRWKSSGPRVWGRNAVDSRFVGPAFERAGVRRMWNLNHALRRTCGRVAWLHGVPLEKISYLLGHEDTRTTRKYLALNLEDVRSVIGVLDAVFPSAQVS